MIEKDREATYDLGPTRHALVISTVAEGRRNEPADQRVADTGVGTERERQVRLILDMAGVGAEVAVAEVGECPPAGAALATTGVNFVVGQGAIAFGASAGFRPLTLPVFAAFTALGVIAGFAGWSVAVRRATRPGATLRVLVPAGLLLSRIPVLVLMATSFIPEISVSGAIALMLMHLVVAAVALPVYARVLPVK
ncbi:hypothetical protein E1263_22610 [Kribbella antibiotica]|uniref:Uncharacterized protein n=1 Tax=Kribbella antibiotica TaxID=190195 RepID=A0A4V2YPE7_9ACTN|nr:hypothetical protein [Kribbella antibiotica]TDD57687.1 hypothetical protein E1263_22610 [Kribbella antibiotica]